MFNHVYLFTYFYSSLITYTNLCLLILLMFTRVDLYLAMFTRVYLHLAMFTRVYLY